MDSRQVYERIDAISSEKDADKRSFLVSDLQDAFISVLRHRREICEKYGLDASWATADKIQFDLIPYVYESEENGEKIRFIPMALHENNIIRQLNFNLDWLDENDEDYVRKVKSERLSQLQMDVADKTAMLEQAKKRLADFESRM